MAPRRGRPPAASLDQVVRAALALVDRDGLDAFSVRRVADEVGVANMTVYGHVADREELLRLVVDQVFAEVATDDLDGLSPNEVLHELGRRIRAAFLAHPAVCPLLARPGPIFGAEGARVLEAQFAAMHRLGLEPAQSLESYALYLVALLGDLVVAQVGEAQVLVADLEEARAAAVGDVPHLAAVTEVEPQITPEQRHEWLVAVLDAGIAAVGWPSPG